MKYRLRKQGLNHQAVKSKHAGKGVRSNRLPATVQTYPKPQGKNADGNNKITIRYGNSYLAALKRINSVLGFWNVRRIGGVIFNKRNSKWADTWTKIFGVQARIPYPLKEKEYAIGENVLCDANYVTVVGKRNGYVQILPQIVRLYEVDVRTGETYEGGLYWYLYPDPKTGQIWIVAELLEDAT